MANKNSKGLGRGIDALFSNFEDIEKIRSVEIILELYYEIGCAYYEIERTNINKKPEILKL